MQQEEGQREGNVEDGQKTDMQDELDQGFKRGGEVKEALISRERWNKVTSVLLPPCYCLKVHRVSPRGFVTH